MRAAVCVVLGLLSAAPAAAQDERCIFRIREVGRQGVTQQTSTGTNYFAGGGVRLFCQGTAITMESDSVAAYNGGELVYFVGQARYRDSTLATDADQIVYHQAGARWEAQGRVFTRNLLTGSTLRGPTVDYYRAVPGGRPQPEMYAVGRPRIEYAVRDSTGAAQEPYVIVADRVRMIGEDKMWAGGRSEIDRSDFLGRSDSLWLDVGALGRGSLIGGHPRLQGLGPDSFAVAGRRIDLTLVERNLREVLALDSATARNADWDLAGDSIALALNEERALEGIQAWGHDIRPVAQSDAYVVRGDSLVLDLPGQRLRQLRAYGGGYLSGAPDSVTGDPDWLAGDTVVADFMAADTVADAQTVLSRLTASGDAQSFRQIYDVTRPAGGPSINYVVGTEIVITMLPPPAEGVDRVDVRGEVQGVQLEPETRQASRTPESPPAAEGDGEGPP